MQPYEKENIHISGNKIYQELALVVSIVLHIIKLQGYILTVIHETRIRGILINHIVIDT